MYFLPRAKFSRVAAVRCGLPPTTPDIDSSSHLHPLSFAKMTSPFPLLRLPRLALIPVFQYTESIDVIAVSLLSKKAYNVSKIFRKFRDYLYITVDLRNEKSVTHCFYMEGITDHVMTRNRRFTHENTGLTASQWLERILDVTNCESLEELYLCESPQLEVCNTFALLTKVRNLNIRKECSDSFAKKALEIVSPVTREIILFKIPFETREEFQTFLKSNLNYLSSQPSTFSKFKFTLDDVLFTNALKLNLTHAKLNLKELNLFFKNWMRKKSDSRLEHLIVCTSEKVNVRNLLGGLKAVQFPRDQNRAFHYSIPLDCLSVLLFGGYDIIRKADGKKATILFIDVGGQWSTALHFLVWQSLCSK
ncbi:hypothetical protein GCK72_021294 [Caenorhabditis remanei]|uniref:F-box domain-containing protein n=1 Tax=Caenorhabditis remanei TaxID=31234 RepID=A0A6A5GHQ6_CAERE|nr:hypothetical protein GCK72_021294 [Caenorhabditis remanei]KAF1754730.1 hypothetical protein GCK72_021294 [Caenorhabditis remanei]